MSRPMTLWVADCKKCGARGVTMMNNDKLVAHNGGCNGAPKKKRLERR